ncbi:MAG: hypothetical protein L0Y58_23635 [Verrucomicrobia subdivision 3 bacterium]|nr:hypothetical protein [Limisphaerales bacterium]
MPVQSRLTSLLLSLVLFSSGAIALVYEVVWQRQFSLLFGNAAPATAAVLVAFFGGLAIGSFGVGTYVGKASSPLAVYAVLELLIGLGALAVGPILSLYAKFYPSVIATFGTAPTLLLSIKGALAFLAVLVPTTAMGGTSPNWSIPERSALA